MHISASATAEPALAEVVAGAHEAVADRLVQPAVALGRVRIGRGHDAGSAGRAVHEVEVAPANSGRVTPSSTTTLPARCSTGVTQRSASGTWATAVITSVGGTAWRCPSVPVYSLLSESLPDTNGAR